jgi:hypothetical protein
LGFILWVIILISTPKKALVHTCGLSNIGGGFTAVLFGIIVDNIGAEIPIIISLKHI